MLLASALLTAGARSRRAAEGAFPVPARAAFAVLAVAAIAGIAIPLASTSLVRESQSEAREGDLSAALDSARTAVDVRPGAAAQLQEALVLERLGQLGPAARAAGEAAAGEPKDWRPWFVLSRLYAEQGRVGEALEAYRRARLLDRNSILLGLPS
jgi:Flp pilus assembly protein TadD